jgi:polyferredoxin
VLLTTLITTVAMRTPVIMDIIRDRNTLYRDIGRQGIENNYTIRVINKQNTIHDYSLSVSGIDGLTIKDNAEFTLAGESVLTLPISVTAPHESAAGGHVIQFRLDSTDGSGITVVEESRFRGPTDR